MYINLLLGLVALLAVIWLVRRVVRYFRRNEAPSKMLLDEIARRNGEGAKSKKSLGRLAKIRAGHLDLVEDGLEDMRQALAGLKPQNAKLGWERKEDCILLYLTSVAGQVTARKNFIIRWDVQELDMEILAAAEAQKDIIGAYILEWKSGGNLREHDIYTFMRNVSGVIAEHYNLF